MNLLTELFRKGFYEVESSSSDSEEEAVVSEELKPITGEPTGEQTTPLPEYQEKYVITLDSDPMIVVKTLEDVNDEVSEYFNGLVMKYLGMKMFYRADYADRCVITSIDRQSLFKCETVEHVIRWDVVPVY